MDRRMARKPLVIHKGRPLFEDELPDWAWMQGGAAVFVICILIALASLR